MKLEFDKFEHYISLYEFYENLFTEKQKEYFKSYYYFDLSLSEIATNYNITRSAVFDTISKMQVMLEEFENKLSLYKKSELRKKIISELENNFSQELLEKLKEIE